ncbi:MAG: hypothetical protein ABW194_06695 [Novosphingobium sp.]
MLVLNAHPVSARPVREHALVVQASGPSAQSYPIRSRVRGDATVRLIAGDLVTLLDARGTRRLKGPGRFRLSRASRPSASDLRRVAEVLRGLVAPPRSRSRVGAVRGFALAPDVPPGPRGDTLWFVDPEQGGRYCLPAGGTAAGQHDVKLRDGSVRRFEIVAVDVPDPTPEAVALVMLDHGCERQLAFLLERLAAPAR